MKNQHGNLSDYLSEKHIYNRFKYILNDLSNVSGTVLTIGSGDGSFERLLKKANPALSITSIDFNKEFREKLTNVSDTVIIDDFLTYNFNHTFDYLVSIDVIEHIIETDDFLIKARKNLSDNGYFYLITPNLASYHGRLSLLLGYTPAAMDLSTNEGFFGKFWFLRYKDAVHHIRVFTYRAIREMCTYYGFEVKTAIGIDSRLPGIFKHFPGIAGSVCLKMIKSE